MTDEEKTAAAVTAKLVGGYEMQGASFGFYVLSLNGLRFRDASGRPIEFHRVDAEKIVRLYNEDLGR